MSSRCRGCRGGHRPACHGRVWEAGTAMWDQGGQGLRGLMLSHTPSGRARGTNTGSREPGTVLWAGRGLHLCRGHAGVSQHMAASLLKAVCSLTDLMRSECILEHSRAPRAQKVWEAWCCGRGQGLRPEGVYHGHPSQPPWECPECAPSLGDLQLPSQAPRLLQPLQEWTPASRRGRALPQDPKCPR